MEKLKDVDWRGMVKTATQKVKKYTLNLTDLELKVEEATSAETWGPHGSTMNEIADAAFDPENYRQIMAVLARRLQERDENWRMCYKALLLLEHLLKHGPGKIVGDVQSSSSVLERLEHFQYKDANQKDHGVNVRHRAKEILQLVNHPERLREEREKAKANRSKYRGVSGDQMRMSSFGDSGSAFGRTTGGSGGLGSGGGYSSSRRTDSYDETEHDAHYVSKRTATTSAGSEGAAAAPAGGAGGADAVAATRARIDKLKLSGAVREDKAHGGEDSKKRLTDVRVNPKIAASLGLKAPAAAPPPASAAAAAAQASAPAGALDLLGGLDEPAAPVAAAAPPAPATAAAASFDPFAAPAAQPQRPAAAAWDAFGAPHSAAPAVPAAAAPLDLLGGLNGPALALAPQPRQQAAPAAPPVDPFVAFAAPPAPAPLAAAAPKPVTSVVAAGVPGALPEDMFSDLTGIGGRPQQPMAHAPHPGAPASGAGMGGGMGGWAQAPIQAPLAAPPSAGSGFGDFAGGGAGTLSGGSGFIGAPAPSAAAGVQQPGHARSHSRGGSMGRAADFGSLSFASPAPGGASGADPFADLLG